MERTISKLTITFDEPFWVGIYEREHKGKYEVCKITFGSEPKDFEVYNFILKNYNKLRFSQPIKTVCATEKRINPKRMQRQIKKNLQETGVGTKAQRALKLQHEQSKKERKSRSKSNKETDKILKFSKRQQKKKQKHRGH